MPFESDQWEQKCPLSHTFNGKYELICTNSIRNHCHCMENLKTVGFIAIGNDWDLYFGVNRIFYFCDHLGRHLGFLSLPSITPIYAGSYRYYTTDHAEHFGI